MAEEFNRAVEELEEKSPSTTLPASINDLAPKMRLTGTVKQIELYGAFIDIGVGVNAILHVSKMSDRVNRVSDVLNVGEEVTVWVDSVDPIKSQITLTMQEPLAVDWADLQEGQVYKGIVTRLEKFGAFVNIGAEKDGLVHISELSYEYVKHPSEAVQVGDEVKVKVLGFSKRKRRIDLSRKALLESPEAPVVVEEEISLEDEADVELPTAMEIALKRAMSHSEEPVAQAVAQSPKSPSKSKRAQQEDILSRTLKMGKETAE